MTGHDRVGNWCGAAPRVAVLLALLVVVCGLLCGCSGDGDADGATAGAVAIQVALIAESDALVAGQINWLGVLFRVAEPWHLYWDGLNDTGLPPSIALVVPNGWTAGDPVWPAPQRHLSAGGILDHVYFGDVLLMVPVEIPVGVANDSLATVTGTVKWLACADICVPGKQEVRLALPLVAVGTQAAASPSRGIFDRTRSALPREIPADVDGVPPVRWSWDCAMLSVVVETAQSLAFFPGTGCGALTDLITDGAAAGDALNLRFVLRTDTAAGRPACGPARGVLAVTAAQGDTLYWNLDLPAPVAGGGL